MKTKTMAVKAENLSSKELETIEGGRRQQHTYDGGTLQEIIVTPNR